MEHEPTSWLLKLPFLPHDPNLIHVNGAVVVFLLITIGSLAAYLLIRGQMEKHLVPEPRVSLVTVVDVLIESLYNLVVGTIGHHGDKYFPFIAAIFIFVLVSNLFGLLPLSSAPTASVNTTFALGIASYLYFNYQGIKEHGVVGYVKHFLMGLGFMGIPIAALEIFSHALRPLSLGIRLFVNMHVDHAVHGAFESLFAWLLPVPLLLFGVVVCIIQAFVFAILTAVYVQMATEHEH